MVARPTHPHRGECWDDDDGQTWCWIKPVWFPITVSLEDQQAIAELRGSK